jgi:hypothetical protein
MLARKNIGEWSRQLVIFSEIHAITPIRSIRLDPTPNYQQWMHRPSYY